MKKIVLAYSGGLDTSFCIPYLKETYEAEVIAVTVDTGGIDPDEANGAGDRARNLGASDYVLIDGKDKLFRDHLSFLIKGNVLRGQVYPLCVGAERVVQASELVRYARQIGADALAHGSTGAGNDQVRFDSTLHILSEGLEILAPIRSLGLSRAETTVYLKARGFEVGGDKTTYSVNKGLWGTTIGGRETLDTISPLPEAAWADTVSPANAPDVAQTVVIGFEEGVPVSLDGKSLDPVSLVQKLNTIGASHGAGRDVHVGDTILGIKGRVAFEAPAALVLIQAHRELEKIVHTRWQQFHKSQLADFYGMLLHEGQYFDPVMRDIEAFINSSQDVATGEVTVRLFKGHISVDGVSSPFSLFNSRLASYGETQSLWTARDAEGFTRIYPTQARLAWQARQDSQNEKHTPAKQ